MTYKQYLGGLAGATLGFIHGDTPGAVMGWKLGKNLSMPPVRRTTRAKRVKRRPKPYSKQAMKRTATSKPAWMKLGGRPQGNGPSNRRRAVTVTRGQSNSDMSVKTFTIKQGNVRRKGPRNQSTVELTETWNQVYVSGTGKQGIYECRPGFIRTQMFQGVNTGEDQRLVFTQNPFNMDTNRANINAISEATSATPIADPVSSTMWFEGYTTLMMITNFANTNAIYKIYWFGFKRNDEFSTQTQWQNALSRYSGGMPINNTPFNVAAVPVVGYPRVTDYGQNPMALQDMKRLRKVLHYEEKVLSPGETLQFRYKTIVRRVINKQEYEREEGLFLANRSVEPIIVCRPAPGLFEESGERVTIASNKTGINMVTTCHYRTMSESKTKVKRMWNTLITNDILPLNIIDESGDIDVAAQA